MRNAFHLASEYHLRHSRSSGACKLQVGRGTPADGGSKPLDDAIDEGHDANSNVIAGSVRISILPFGVV